MTDHKIGLDIDGVLANFQSALIERADELGLDFYDHWTEWRSWETEYPESFVEAFESTEDDREFWVDIIRPYHHALRMSFPTRGYIPFTPEMYVSSRPKAPSGATKEWLEDWGFPDAPVHVVDSGEEKLEYIEGLDAFVDDKLQTIKEIQTSRLNNPEKYPIPILFSGPWNTKYSKREESPSPLLNVMPNGEFYRANYLTEIPKIINQSK